MRGDCDCSTTEGCGQASNRAGSGMGGTGGGGTSFSVCGSSSAWLFTFSK
jgi:hypothetical protein